MCLMGFIKPTKEDLLIDLPSRQPNFEVPKILIHCTSTRKAKIWGKHKWKKVINYCLEVGLSVGIIGAAAKTQREEYNSGNDEDDLMNYFEGKYLATGEPVLNDLRGRTSLIELVGACKNAKGVISVDAGPLHVAAVLGGVAERLHVRMEGVVHVARRLQVGRREERADLLALFEHLLRVEAQRSHWHVTAFGPPLRIRC